MTNDYANYPSHPLYNVPEEILDAARQELRGAAFCGDVDSDLADPIADAVVMSLLPWLSWFDASPR